jgi:hypothetical protein
MYMGIYVKYLLFTSQFNITWIFWTDFQINSQIYNFMKMRPVGAELFHADGRSVGRTDGRTDRQTDRQTDMTRLITAFLNFEIAPTAS